MTELFTTFESVSPLDIITSDSKKIRKRDTFADNVRHFKH